MSNGVACPICGKNDQSQKVSAIVQSGTSSYQASGSSVGSAYVGGWGPASGFATVSGTSQTVLAEKLMPPEKPETGWNSWPGWLKAIFLFFSIGGVTVWIVTFPLVYLWSWWRHEDTTYKAEVLKWETAVTRWDQLYYCHRDGLVFDPATSKSCPPSQMNTLLYD